MTLQNRKISEGRHPLLKLGSSNYELYNTLRRFPASTALELSNKLHIKHETVKRQLRKLKAEGLIADSGERRGNLPCLIVVTENESGFARDKLDVEITVYVNDYGEYSIKAALKGQLPTAVEDNPKPVHTQRYKMAIPKPDEPFMTRQLFSDDYEPSTTTGSKNSVVIEGEIVDIK